MIAKTPAPPYWAVIFTSLRSGDDRENYEDTGDRMAELAAQQPGYLGIESVGDEVGVTVSYWESLEAIRNWKQNADHLFAQKMGRERWYSAYKTRIACVERDYGFGEAE